jgi:hypothetical protein
MGPPPLPGKAAFNGIKLKRFNWIKVTNQLGPPRLTVCAIIMVVSR